MILIPRKDSAQSTVELMPPPKKENLCSVKRSENCREIILINFMGFQDKDFSHQKLMRVLLLMRSPSSIDPDLIHALLTHRALETPYDARNCLLRIPDIPIWCLWVVALNPGYPHMALRILQQKTTICSLIG